MSSSKPNPAHERHWVCAQRLRTRRLALGLTQQDVVARLQHRGFPTTNRGLSAMENGRGLDLGLLPELAAVLDCTVTYLLGLTTEPWAWQPTGSVGPDRPVPRLRAVNPIGPNGADVLDPTGQGGTGGSEGSRATSYRTRWRDPGSGP